MSDAKTLVELGRDSGKRSRDRSDAGEGLVGDRVSNRASRQIVIACRHKGRRDETSPGMHQRLLFLARPDLYLALMYLRAKTFGQAIA